jgi:hypothetical protein
VQDRAAHDIRVADQQAKGEVPAGAGATDRGGRKAKGVQQRRRVVGLLLRGGRCPAGGAGAASVPAPVVADDSELVGEQFGQRLDVPAVAGEAHDEQHRRAGASDLVVQLGAVDRELCHRLFLSKAS